MVFLFTVEVLVARIYFNCLGTPIHFIGEFVVIAGLGLLIFEDIVVAGLVDTVGFLGIAVYVDTGLVGFGLYGDIFCYNHLNFHNFGTYVDITIR